MAPRGTIWGSICIEVTLSDIETIWTKFGQNPGFSLRNSVSLSPGPAVKKHRYELFPLCFARICVCGSTKKKNAAQVWQRKGRELSQFNFPGILTAHSVLGTILTF